MNDSTIIHFKICSILTDAYDKLW